MLEKPISTTTPAAYATADLHAPEAHDGPLWADLPETAGDVFYALGQVVALCVRDNADLYLAGDNFDGPDPHPRAVETLYRVLWPLARAKLGLYYVLGNHDRGRDWLSPFGPYAIRVDNQKVTTQNGHSITGLSFVDHQEFPRRVANLPPTDVGLYHQSFLNFAGGRGISESILPPHKLAICGDTHVRKVIHPEPGPQLVLSPGPLVPQSIAELEPSVVWSVSQDFQVKPLTLSSRRFLRFDVKCEADADRAAIAMAAIDQDISMPGELRKPVVQIKMSVQISGFADLAHKLAADRGFVVRVSEAKPQQTVNKTTAIGPRSLLAAIAASDQADRVKMLASELIAPGANPTEILGRRLKDLLNETQANRT